MSQNDIIRQVFKNMTAYSLSWDLLWDMAYEMAQENIEGAFDILREGCTPTEKRSINAALRKAGLKYCV